MTLIILEVTLFFKIFMNSRAFKQNSILIVIVFLYIIGLKWQFIKFNKTMLNLYINGKTDFFWVFNYL